ncbi:GDSL-type esterase/lipase family protein [Fredinandcohnia humi]
MKVLFKRLSYFLLVLILALILPAGVFAGNPEKKFVNYVALGDSLAAGWTPYGQDGLGYPEFLKDRFEQSQYTVDFSNFGFPGYTSTDLKNQLNREDVKASLRDANVITIDIGANDLLRALKINPSTTATAIYHVQQNLNDILYKIKALNPKAELYVMGYYNAFPYVSEQEQALLLPLLDSLNGVIQSVTLAYGGTYVSTEKIIAKKFEEYLPNPLDIHLSTTGYQLIAKEFWKAIVSH